MSTFNLLVNENNFRYQSNATDSWNRVILHFMRHNTDMINTILKSWIMMITWSGNATTGRKTIYGSNHIM